jgi:hypothetical protein
MDQIHEVALAIYAEVPRTAMMPVTIKGATDGRLSSGAVVAPVSWSELTSEMQRPYLVAARKAIEASRGDVYEKLALYGEACRTYGKSPSFATTLAMTQAFDAVLGPAVVEARARRSASSRMGIMAPDGGRTLPDELWRPATAEPSITILRDPPMATLQRMVKATTGDVDIRTARQMYEAITKGGG